MIHSPFCSRYGRVDNDLLTVVQLRWKNSTGNVAVKKVSQNNPKEKAEE
jgi:hypothetical protein